MGVNKEKGKKIEMEMRAIRKYFKPNEDCEEIRNEENLMIMGRRKRQWKELEAII